MKNLQPFSRLILNIIKIFHFIPIIHIQSYFSHKKSLLKFFGPFFLVDDLVIIGRSVLLFLTTLLLSVSDLLVMTCSHLSALYTELLLDSFNMSYAILI
jgi:hypothetical protein